MLEVINNSRDVAAWAYVDVWIWWQLAHVQYAVLAGLTRGIATLKLVMSGVP